MQLVPVGPPPLGPRSGPLAPVGPPPGIYAPNVNPPFGSAPRSHHWRAILIGVGVFLLCVGILAVIYQVLSERYTPQRAAIAFVHALSTKNGAAILKEAVIVPATQNAQTQTLTTAPQITAELSLPQNSIGNVGNITILQSTTSGSSASVTLQFTSSSWVQTDTFHLIKSTAGAHFLFGNGWIVSISPATLNINSESDASTVTIAGIPVDLHGGSASVGIFPSTVIASVPKTSNFVGQTQVVSANTEGSKQVVSFTPTIQLGVQEAAVSAVENELVACIESSQFSPQNCPNQDPNAPTQDVTDSYTGITWLLQGQAVTSPTVSVGSGGDIQVAASLTASDLYTDNYNDGLGDFSTQTYTNGPYTWNYVYNVTNSNGTWTASFQSSSASNTG